MISASPATGLHATVYASSEVRNNQLPATKHPSQN